MRRRWRKFTTNGRARMVLVVAIALVAGTFVELRARAASELRNDWQPAGTVLVTTRDIAAGETITADHVRVTPSPAALRPTSAVATIDAAVAARRIGSGEIITTPDLVGPATGPGDGQRWVAVPVDPLATPPLGPGAHVDLIGLDPFGASATVIATSVTVVTSTEQTVIVQIVEHEVPAVAASVASGLTLVVRAPG